MINKPISYVLLIQCTQDPLCIPILRPLVDIDTEFEMEEVTVILHWSQESHENFFISYNVIIEPVIGATITMNQISNTSATNINFR